MQDLPQIYGRYQKYMYYFLSLAVIGWGFTPYKAIFLGWILGTVFSFFNLWILARKVERFGRFIVQGKKVRSIGMFTRLASAVLAIVIAQRYPEYFQLISVIVGLMTSYIVIMIDYLVQKVRK